jgi:peptide/nickel transport system substrate-binding protein
LAAMVTMMDRVEMVDDYTVKIYLKYPHRPFPLYLSFPYCVMLPSHLANVDPKREEFLIGTGPFKFKKQIPGKVWIYERNPDYFIKGLPYLDGVEVYGMSWDAAVDAFAAGRLSMAGGFRYGLEFKTTLEKAKKYVPEAIIKLKPISVLRGIIFNVAGLKGRKGPWQDVRVRRAMALVTDFPGAIIAMPGSLELGINSGLVPSYMPTGLPWQEVEKILGIDKPMDQRIQEAKKLIKEAGYPDGFKAELITRASAKSYVTGSEFMMESWKKNLNIQIDLKPLESALFFPRRDTGDFDVMFDGLRGAIGGTPEETLAMFVSGATENPGKWSNQEYDRLFNELMRETDPKKRQDISVRMQRIFLAELPFMLNFTPVLGTAYRPTLHGFVIQTGHTGWACMDRVWMEK